MFKIYGLAHGMSVLLLSAAAPNPDPSNPANFMPSGPNFGFFSSLSGTTQLIIGIALVVVFFIGVFLFFTGLGSFRLRDPETGKATQGLSKMIAGAVLVIASFVTVPLINLLIGIGQSTAPLIK